MHRTHLIFGLLLAAQSLLFAGGGCPSAASYLNPANPAGPKVTLASFGVTSCYYVAANGSDSNDGLSEASGHPWLHAPGMPNCTGTCKSANISAGTGIIMRGGDTWHSGNSSAIPFTGGTWSWGVSGTSSNAVYIGVDQSWFSGSVWARPILAGDNPRSTSGVSSCTYTGSGGTALVSLNNVRYIHFDNFEMLGICWSTASAWFVAFNGAVNGYQNPIIVENNYVHGWTHKSYSNNCGSGGVCASNGTAFSGSNGQYGMQLQFNVVDGSDSDPTSLAWEAPGAGDGYIVQYNVFRYNGADVTPNTCHIIHDNLWEYIYNANDGGTHTDLMQCYGEANDSAHPGDGTPNLFYNNVVRNLPVSVSSVWWWFPPPGFTDYTFNNVFHDYNGGGNYDNFAQGSGQGNMIMWNNTMEGSGSPPGGCIICNGNSGTSTIQSINNHWITNGGSSASAVFQSTAHVTESLPIYQALSAANNQGYNSANDFAPIASTDITVTASGTNETNALCSSFSNALAVAACKQGITGVSYNATNHTVVYPAIQLVPRPSTGAWNVGAYQFGSGTAAGGPNPLTNLSAIVH